MKFNIGKKMGVPVEVDIRKRNLKVLIKYQVRREVLRSSSKLRKNYYSKFGEIRIPNVPRVLIRVSIRVVSIIKPELLRNNTLDPD